jgi:hypothetical protein
MSRAFTVRSIQALAQGKRKWTGDKGLYAEASPSGNSSVGSCATPVLMVGLTSWVAAPGLMCHSHRHATGRSACGR